MATGPATAERPEAPLFADGLGERVVAVDPATGDLLQILRVRPELLSVPSFEFALRERAARLANFRHAYYARVRRIDRHPTGLAIVSDHVEGVRLSEMLRVAHLRGLHLDLNAALCLLRQLVPSVALLHENARDVAHGLVAPERLIVTPRARLIVVEHVLGSAVEQLQFTRDRLWHELRASGPVSAGAMRLDHRADVTAIGLTALSLVLGRPLADDEYPLRVSALLASARARAVGGNEQPLPEALQTWIGRALQIDVRSGFTSATDAQIALEEALAQESGFVAAPIALETFLSRYIAAMLDPLPEPAPRPTPAPPVSVAPPAPPRQAPSVFAPPAIAPPAAAAPPARPAPPVAPPPVPAAPPPPVARTAPPPPPAPTITPASYAAPARPAPPPADVTPSFAPVAPVTHPAPSAPPASVVLPPPAPPPPAPPPVYAPVVSHAPAAPPKPAAPPPLVVPQAPARDINDLLKDFDLPPATSEPEAVAAAAKDAKPSAPGAGGARGGNRLVLMVLAAAVIAGGGYFGWQAFTPNPAAPAMGTVSVTSTPVGAAVFVDGVGYGNTPARISLPPGPHNLELRNGGVPRSIAFTLAAGAEVSHAIELPQTPLLGSLQVNSDPPGAKVTVDGVDRGTAPVTINALTPGEHDVVVQADGGTPVKQRPVVQAGVMASVLVPTATVAAGPVSGWLSVKAPVTVEIREGGRMIGSSDTDKIMLTAGRHDIDLVNDTLGLRASRTVQVPAGKVQAISVEMPMGSINLNAVPWAEVWIDGRRVGETPIGNHPLAIGPHEVIFRNPQLGEQKHAVTVTALAPVRLSADLTKK